MTSPSDPAWQSAPSNSTNDPQATCEYCNCPQAYSYYEDMHPDTDTESEGDADMKLDMEYQALFAHAIDIESVLGEQL
eukprot:12903501-Prorocentrum_lima.AAC.1